MKLLILLWNNIFEFTAFIFKTIESNNYFSLTSSLEIIIQKIHNAFRFSSIIIIIFKWNWSFVKILQNFRARNENVINVNTLMNMLRKWIKSMKNFKFRWFEFKFDKKNMLIIIENTFFDVKLKTKFNSILKTCASNVLLKNYLIKTKIFLKSLLWSARMFIVWNFSIIENVTTYSMFIFYIIMSMIFCSNKHRRYFFRLTITIITIFTK